MVSSGVKAGCAINNGQLAVKLFHMSLQVSYSPVYKYELPAGHRFPMEKYELIGEQLLYEGTVALNQLHSPEPVRLSEVLLTHNEGYVRRFLNEELTALEIRRIGFPMSKALIDRELIITQGTIENALFALRTHGCGLNVAGGTHHAYADHGEGFCMLNDMVIAANVLLDRQLVKQILIVDLDVHQGNGTAKLMQDNASVFTFSMHGAHNFPAKKEESDLDIALQDGTNDEFYLARLKETVPQLLERVKPEFVFYLAGVDVLASDRLGRLGLTREGCLARDKFVLETLHRAELPVAVSMGGGYSPDIKDIVEAHCNTFRVAAGLWG